MRALLIVVMLAAPARADDEGRSLVIAGGALTGVAAAAGTASFVSLIGLARCSGSSHGDCQGAFGLGAVIGGAVSLLTGAIGLPLMNEGLRDRDKARKRALTVGLAPQTGGASLSVSGSF